MTHTADTETTLAAVAAGLGIDAYGASALTGIPQDAVLTAEQAREARDVLEHTSADGIYREALG